MMANNVEFYEQFAAEYHLFFADLDANMEQEGRWLDEILRRYGVRTVLDASCGAGRQAIPLAQRGYTVTGADASASMLREAHRLAEKAHVDFPLYHTRFTELPHVVDRKFDAVLTMGNGLCNQECSADVIASLAAMRTCCRPGGIALAGIKDFDVIRKERRRFHGHTIHDEDGERTILFQVWDFADPLLLCTTYSMRGSDRSWQVHSAQTRELMLGATEFAAVAREAGFNSVERLDHLSEAVYALR